MALKEETDGTVYLVITNQDGSSTRTNVTSLIEDTIINSSNTVNASAVTDGINKKTTYTLEIKPNSVALNHLTSEAVAKVDSAIEAASTATDAKNVAINNATTSTTKANEASQSATAARTSANNAEDSAEQAEASKVAAQAAQTAAEKARDEAQKFAGGDFVTPEEFEEGTKDFVSQGDMERYVDEQTESFATKQYVEENGGKIDSISINGVKQTIDGNKNVDITVPETDLTAYSTTEEMNTALEAKAPMYSYGTADLTAGTSELETGKLYFVYE